MGARGRHIGSGGRAAARTAVSITVDGRNVAARPGETILDAARRAGVRIPTLCHDGKLEPYASCWICAVRVDGGRRLSPACATRVRAGMEVVTADEEIVAARRLCLELLLSDHCGDCLPPCLLACPAGCDARGYLGLLLERRPDDALRLIMETVPLPATIGRICPHPCEEACRRGLVDEPASICSLKRFAAEAGSPARAVPPREAPTGRRVAVVGSGPAGLTAAYFLALRGHAVTILEARERPGGMLRYGIPAYRLPKEVLDGEIDLIRSLGVEIRCASPVGGGDGVTGLFGEGYGAVLLAVGAQRNRAMGIEGEELEGVEGGIDFLAAVAAGERRVVRGSVIVVGGGDTAVDAARTALRLGASDVSIVYRRSRDEMPAAPAEVRAAEEEGIGIRFLTLPVRIARRDGRLEIACARMALGPPDESGRRSPVPVPGGDHLLSCDTVIMAIGQSVDASVLDGTGLAPSPRGRIGARDDTLQTGLAAVFAAGDCVTGPDIAVAAVAAGRRAAHAIDSFLRTGAAASLPAPASPARRDRETIDPSEYASVERLPRATCPALPAAERRRDFSEAERTLPEEDALREAYRCMECGCEKAGDCTLRDLAVEYGVGLNRFGSPPKRWKNDDRHPYIIRDPDRCIKCARCIRVCLEVQGIGAWGFEGRGFDMQVAPPFGRPLQDTDCESCGQCLTACPTGALIERRTAPARLHALAERIETTCGNCGDACPVALRVAGGRILAVEPLGNGNLCERGRFGCAPLSADDRIILPRIRGRRGRITWEEAAAAVREGLAGLRPREIAVFVSPRCTDEEAHEAQRIARCILGTNNICPSAGAVPAARMLERPLPPADLSASESADAIVLVEPAAMRADRVALLSVIRAVRGGARLLIAGRPGTKLDALASAHIPFDGRRPAASLRRAAAFIAGARRPAVVFDRDSIGPAAVASLHRFARKNGCAVVGLHSEINARGLLEAGVSPFLLPGRKPVTDAAARGRLEREWGCRIPAWRGMDREGMLAAMRRGRITAALFLGPAPEGDREMAAALRKVPFVLAQALVPSPIARLAHVVLPAASWAESAGTVTRFDGGKARFERALPPLCGYGNAEIWGMLFRPENIIPRR
ncbi:MAG: FAD-dependent oxidoreductase [bacterium]|nr:FAD-dependent oxidoreductase [bacterium]